MKTLNLHLACVILFGICSILSVNGQQLNIGRPQVYNPVLPSAKYFPLDEQGKPIFPSLLIPGTDEELVYIPPQQSPQQNGQMFNNMGAQNQAYKYPQMKQMRHPPISQKRRRKRLLPGHKRSPKIPTGQRSVRSVNFQDAPSKPIFLSPDGLLYQVIAPAGAFQTETMSIDNVPVLTSSNAYPVNFNGAPILTHQWPNGVQYQPSPQIQDLGVIEKMSPSGHPIRRHILKVRRRKGQHKRVQPVAPAIAIESPHDTPK